jgi:WD40 repeat protein
VTAMCFRPANNDADEGRYLWCGTKDGHLWELDIKTGDITDTRAFVHSSAVSHIFRYKSWIMSLEEGGKLHVFEVQENRRIPQCRTIRVQERFNFAKLIGGRLWTSTGPATRSTTNAAASRGPTIRVYDPCAPGNTLSAGTTVWPSEWTGAVTSATCMPMHPGTVYLGHEGGYVSVWDAEQLQCLQVFKISANDILALEGVGERLWAAGRKGMISVYDVSERPWRTTNVWTAHV